MKNAIASTVAAAVLAVCVSCGISSYSYVSPITSVTATLNSSAVISLPNASDVITIDFTAGKIPTMTVRSQTKNLGSDYEIYYRIYLSDKMLPTVNTDTLRKDANPSLAKDWAAAEPVTVDSNNRSSEVATMFSNMKYYSIMTNSSGGLMRSNGNGAFNPVPSDRLFMTDYELFDSANLTDNVNPDVAGMDSGTPMYAYASMYIAMREFNPQTLTPIYSAPTFINVFLLPSKSNVPVVSVTGVSITASSTSSAAVKLIASVTPSNAMNSGVTWSVDNNKVEVRPLSDGNAVIIAGKEANAGKVTVTVRTNDGGFTASHEVSLSARAADSIAISGTAISNKALILQTGAENTLTATVYPADASNGVKWESSNTAVVTVSGGVVKAVSVGEEAVITATTTDGTELTDTCNVTVVAN
jgi:uncharacterized protein YjdB